MRRCVATALVIWTAAALLAAAVDDVPERYRKLKNPLKPGRDLLKEASVAYELNCSYCHGDTGKGDGPKMTVRPGKQPPNFQSGDFAKRSEQWIMWRISEGVAKTAMIPYKNELSEKDRWSLVLLVRSFAPKPGKGK